MKKREEGDIEEEEGDEEEEMTWLSLRTPGPGGTTEGERGEGRKEVRGLMGVMREMIAEEVRNYMLMNNLVFRSSTTSSNTSNRLGDGDDHNLDHDQDQDQDQVCGNIKAESTSNS